MGVRIDGSHGELSDRAVTVALLILGVAALLVLAFTGNDQDRGIPNDDRQPVTTCQEDMDCWDCTSMGNRRCGPTTTNGDS